LPRFLGEYRGKFPGWPGRIGTYERKRMLVLRGTLIMKWVGDVKSIRKPGRKLLKI